MGVVLDVFYSHLCLIFTIILSYFSICGIISLVLCSFCLFGEMKNMTHEGRTSK